jgi:hypothetical protein
MLVHSRSGTGVWGRPGKGSLSGLGVTWIISSSPHKSGADVNKCCLLAKGSDAPTSSRPLFSAANYTDDARISRPVVVTSP